MATIQANCANCSRLIRGSAEHAGKRVRCPDCGQPVQLPGIETDPFAGQFNTTLEPRQEPSNPEMSGRTPSEFAGSARSPHAPHDKQHKRPAAIRAAGMKVLAFGVLAMILPNVGLQFRPLVEAGKYQYLTECMALGVLVIGLVLYLGGRWMKRDEDEHRVMWILVASVPLYVGLVILLVNKGIVRFDKFKDPPVAQYGNQSMPLGYLPNGPEPESTADRSSAGVPESVTNNTDSNRQSTTPTDPPKTKPPIIAHTGTPRVAGSIPAGTPLYDMPEDKLHTMATLAAEFGDNKVAWVSIIEIRTTETLDSIRERLETLANNAEEPAAWRLTLYLSRGEVMFAPVDDLEAFHKSLNLGELVETEPSERHATFKALQP